MVLTNVGPLDALLRYQVLFHEKSRTWHLKLCQAVRLLLEYSEANGGIFERPKDLFQSFSVRLLSGTFGADGFDPSGLYWLPRRAANARKLIGQLTELSQWLAREYDVPTLAPLRDATSHEQVLAAAAWAYRNNASFLGHAESRARAVEALRRTPHVPKPKLPNLLHDEVIRFPANRFGDLLFKGFVGRERAPGELPRINLRDVLITLMMHGAGVRLSECFHLWFGDVQEHPLDPTIAWVRIGHPTHALTKWTVDGADVEGTRAEFLATRGLTPRHLLMGKKHAGWKNPALDGKWYLELHWSEPDYGRLFLRLWRLYLRRVVGLDRRHPYAWVTFGGRSPGDPFTIAEFKKAHERAVRRIGLVPSRTNGTRPHGHRHDYGQRLVDAGVSPRVVRKCLHHASLTSQLVYTQPDRDRMTKELEAAHARMAAGAKLDFAQLQQKYLNDVGLLEGGA